MYIHIFFIVVSKKKEHLKSSVRHTVVSYMYNFDVRNLNTNTSENKNRTYTTHEQYLGLKHRILIHEHEYKTKLEKQMFIFLQIDSINMFELTTCIKMLSISS